MKYFDVVANRRASLWRDVKAETTKIQMEQRSAGGHNVIECKDWRETITCVVAVLKSLHFLASKQNQFVTFR